MYLRGEGEVDLAPTQAALDDEVLELGLAEDLAGYGDDSLLELGGEVDGAEAIDESGVALVVEEGVDDGGTDGAGTPFSWNLRSAASSPSGSSPAFSLRGFTFAR